MCRMKLDEMMFREIGSIYEKWDTKDPSKYVLESNDCRTKLEHKEYKKETDKFEKSVLLHLFKNRRALGIEKIYKLKNVRVDAALKLNSGKTIVLEVKYMLNWRNCCNARIEILVFIGEQFYAHKDINLPKPEGALIIFHEFGGGWENKKGHKHEKGWYHFYKEEEMFRKKFQDPRIIPMDIAQYNKKQEDKLLYYASKFEPLKCFLQYAP